jgi:hypothetical protein
MLPRLVFSSEIRVVCWTFLLYSVTSLGLLMPSDSTPVQGTCGVTGCSLPIGEILGDGAGVFPVLTTRSKVMHSERFWNDDSAVKGFKPDS